MLLNGAICKKCKYVEKIEPELGYKCAHPNVLVHETVGNNREGFKVEKKYPSCIRYNSEGECTMFKRSMPWHYFIRFVKASYNIFDDGGVIGYISVSAMWLFFAILLVALISFLYAYISGGGC